MNLKRLSVLFGLTTAFSISTIFPPTTHAQGIAGVNTDPFTLVSGIGGMIDYDMALDPANGWYSETPSPYEFKLAFKQGERNSAHPVEVATLSVDQSEQYEGCNALQMQIIARHENDPKSTAAYKVAISSVKPGDDFSPQIFTPKDWFHGFAMKIDPLNFHMQSGQPVMYEEFWQGSPFGPPASLIMMTPEDAAARGWQTGAYGNFALELADDEHGPLTSFGTKPQYFNLGPITLGTWMNWIVQFRPSPSTPNGVVGVWLNNVQVLLLNNIKVGFDPTNPQYKAAGHIPATSIPDVDTLLYRQNGDSFQRVYFCNIKFGDTLRSVQSAGSR